MRELRLEAQALPPRAGGKGRAERVLVKVPPPGRAGQGLALGSDLHNPGAVQALGACNAEDCNHFHPGRKTGDYNNRNTQACEYAPSVKLGMLSFSEA